MRAFQIAWPFRHRRSSQRLQGHVGRHIPAISAPVQEWNNLPFPDPCWIRERIARHDCSELPFAVSPDGAVLFLFEPDKMRSPGHPFGWTPTPELKRRSGIKTA